MDVAQFLKFGHDFLDAAFRGDVSKLQSLTTEHGHDFSYALLKDDAGGNALHVAASEGKTTACRFLLEVLNFDINSTDNKGSTPLFEASWNGHWPTTEFLINSGADVTKSNNYGATLLHCAAKNSDDVLMKYLLDHSVNPNSNSEVYASPLLLSMLAGSIECMELLLKARANPDEYCSGLKTTPLGFAASTTQNTEMIKCLLKHGANPNMLDKTGTKAIERAAEVGFHEGVELLLPATSRIEGYPDWSIRGIIKNVPSKEARELRKLNKGELFEQAKEEGNQAFRSQNYEDAINWYKQAIDADPTAAEVFSNRSLCWIHLNKAGAALADAKTCVELRPRWAKAHFREGAAWMALKNYQQATEAFSKGLALEPHNKGIQEAHRAAQAGHNSC